LNPGQTIRFSLQWDDPFYTTNGVDTDLDFYVLSGNNVVLSSFNNNISNQTPFEFIGARYTGSSPLNLDVVIQLDAGPEPGRIKYVNFGSNIASEYAFNAPTVVPHAAAVNARAVAAVPYYDQDVPEPFTSQGPSTILFNPDGTRKATPEIRQKPDFAAIDGTDTTFFPPGGDISGDDNDFPNFFGTSAAAPHAAAVAALIRAC
jgi:subtilisin family serine protease